MCAWQRACALALLLNVHAACGIALLQVRATGAQMADISAFDDIWGIDAKKAIFDKWDPEAPRDYENFNPFERNDESAMCDTNGCFPGQSRGYKSPNRPDQSWQIMQKEKEKQLQNQTCFRKRQPVLHRRRMQTHLQKFCLAQKRPL